MAVAPGAPPAPELSSNHCRPVPTPGCIPVLRGHRGAPAYALEVMHPESPRFSRLGVGNG